MGVWQCKHLSFRRKSFSLRLISSGGKMDRMPLTCAMGLALECFQKIIPSKGMIYWKIFPTTRHSIHVRMIVRKATLNGPKPFGYFWASKVTKNLNFVFFRLPFRRKSFSNQLISLEEKWLECRWPDRWDWTSPPFSKQKIPSQRLRIPQIKIS